MTKPNERFGKRAATPAPRTSRSAQIGQKTLVQAHKTLFLQELRGAKFYEGLEQVQREELKQAVSKYALHTGTNSEVSIEIMKKRFVGETKTLAKVRRTQIRYWRKARLEMIQAVMRHVPNKASEPFYIAIEKARKDYAQKLQKLIEARKKS